MYNNGNRKLLYERLLLLIGSVAVLALSGCATMRSIGYEEYRPPQVTPVSKEDDVIGRLAYIRIEKGDTLPDIARHFSLGINAVSAANPGVDIWVPEDGERILLPMSFILPDAPRRGIVINLAAMRLFQYIGDGKSMTINTYPVGVGTEERPSPRGQMYVERKMARPTWHVPASIAADHRKKGDPLPPAIPPGPDNPLGEYAMYLSKASYLVHGTNKPASIGLRATNGCIRLYPEDIRKVFERTPVKTPVAMVNQPYLVGQHNGVLYMEAHATSDGIDSDEFDMIYRKLRRIEKESGRTLDWSKVKQVLAEARGIPVPILELVPGSAKRIEKPVELRHPSELYGKPEVPQLRKNAWSVLAADLPDKVDALRLAAMINHQGPQIPASVVSKNGSYRVIAGPFNDIKEAKNAVHRLKIDMEINGTLIEPVRKR
jgi:L,D-transpeptidase ErfK/SrfK